MANNMTETIEKTEMSEDSTKTSTDTAGQSWFNRPVPGVKQQLTPQLTAVETEPSTKCPNCLSMITNTALIFNGYVCPHCDHHLAMTARERLQWFLEQVDGEIGQEFVAKDPLGFVDSKPYPERMTQAQTKTGESEALIVLYGKLRNLEVVACGFDFQFMGGSMGSVVGDRLYKRRRSLCRA